MNSKGLYIKNKKAFFNYDITEKIEAGIVLQGTEVKSIKAGKVSLTEGYVVIDNQEELWLKNVAITEYDFGNRNNHTLQRQRKLLLHKKEITNLQQKTKLKGQVIIPLAIYLKKGKIKVEIGLGKGRKSYDKRQVIAKRDVERRLKKEIDL